MISQTEMLHILSVTADCLTVLGISFAAIWSWIQKRKNPTAFNVSQFIVRCFRSALILLMFILLVKFVLSQLFIWLLFVIQGNVPRDFEYWQKGQEVQILCAYFLTLAFSLPLSWVIGTTLWTSSLEYTVITLNLILPESKKIKTDKYKQKEYLEIIKAEYKTDDAHTANVTETVKGMVKNDKLEITVSNDLVGGPEGDPHPGAHKNLIITYRINGVEKLKVIPEYRNGIIPEQIGSNLVP